MDELTEAVWRKALQARGRDWVMSELHRRPGRPQDTLYDVVFQEPYPTRAYCFQWCSEDENRLVRMSWPTYAAIFALALLIVCILKGVSAWNQEDLSIRMQQSKATAQASGGSGHGAGSATNTDALTNDIPTMGTSSGSGTTSGQSSRPSMCGYITFDRARCKQQN